MKIQSKLPQLARRDFLKSGGALIVGFQMGHLLHAQPPGGGGGVDAAAYAAAQRGTLAGPPPADQLDTWLAIHADNTATVYIGYAELGQGTSTALLQVAAEELDLTLDQVRSVGLDTHITPNQGGTYSSASIARGSPAIRNAAAEARQYLLRLASERLEGAVENLTVAGGIVTRTDNPFRSISYGSLLGGQLFNVEVSGSAPVKSPDQYKVVGKDLPRKDTPLKVRGDYVYMQHLRVDNMLHGRVVRPRGQMAYGEGAKIQSVDESSIADIAGARIVRRGDFLGVVSEKEWDAVKAAAQLRVTWETPESLPGNAGLHEQMLAETTEDNVAIDNGDIEAAVRGAQHVVSFQAFGPYQMHAPFGPNCALADVTGDQAMVMCSTQDVYALRRLLSRVLNLSQEQVRVQYHEGSGTYGHSCHDDVGLAAALLSQETGRPVRLQFMRWDEHGWDLYGPPHVGQVRVAADAAGKLVAYEYESWHHNWSNIETSEQLTGVAPAERGGFAAQGVNQRTCGHMYKVENWRLVNHKVPALKYLRGAWLRSPLDLSLSFTAEQAIDQLAYLLNKDPWEFRRDNISDERWLGVLEAVATASGWTGSTRRAASRLSNADIVTGRGIGLGTHLQSWGGAVAEIEVNKRTGKVRVLHMYGAIDCGLAVNPANVEAQITGQMVQTASRMLLEEVKFNRTNVTGLDWNSYPVARFEDCPQVTPIVVQRLTEPSSGAGEESMAAGAAAIGNAFFDATGVRMREYPFTPERVLAALNAASL